MNKKYLIWLDILGFEKLSQEIAKRSGINERKVRDDFVTIINEKVKKLENDSYITGKNYGGGEDWILVTSSLDLAFRAVSEILNHNTEYRHCEKIPLEIGIGVGEYDRWAKFDGRKLVIEKATIEFLKTYLINYYKEWYKQHNFSKSVKSTFIVLTKSAYAELEPLDREIFQEIAYKYMKNGKMKSVGFFFGDMEKIREKGTIFEFLDKIGVSGSKLYGRINSLFIPPIEYKEIKEITRDQRVVFITGTAEYGKTYTAVRLLWEYFVKGYEPIWYKGEEKWERRQVRERLANIESEVKPHRIIYFEDPFGKMTYEERESLERDIGRIIETIHNVEDVYVIVTSREEVFKRFTKENLSSIEIEEFETKLNIKRASYNTEKRQEILLAWARSKGCEWLRNASLRNTVLANMKEAKELPTPLSIRDFAISTIAVIDKNNLLEKMTEKSEETTKRFAKEIQKMTEDKIIFLLFPFVFDFPIKLIREEYEKVAPRIKMRNPDAFEKILDWFKDDKIAINEGKIAFSHDSYFEAMKYFLTKEMWPTPFTKNIFSEVLLNLSEREEAIEAVSNFVVTYFDRLSRNVATNILLKLSEKNEAAEALADAVASHFFNLPNEIRNDLLLKLSKRGKAAHTVAITILNRYDRLPKKVKILLFKLAEDDFIAKLIVWTVAENFDRFPPELSNMLFKLSERNSLGKDVVRALGECFDQMPGSLQKLAGLVILKHRQVIVDLSRSVDVWDQHVVHTLLSQLITDKDDRVRKKAQELINSIGEN
jgi:hypothetical protein